MAKCANQIELTRDVYGFTVRPHHLKRYKEYAIIYEEEEAERSTRWEQFLNTYWDESVEAGHDAKTGDGRIIEKGELRKFKTWNEIRPRLYPVEKALKSRFKRIHVRRDNGLVATVAALVETHKSSGHGVSEDESDDEFYDVERSDMIQDSLSSTDVSADESDGEKDDEESPCPWKEELDALVRGGVPMAMRGEIWQIFMGASIRRVHGHYQELLALLTNENGNSNGSGVFYKNATSGFKISDRHIIEKWANQIEKDLPRTFPGHPALDKDGRNALRHLLTAYAQHNPNVGYCQAMNFFAGLLLLMMSEENAFWTLAGLLDDCFEGYYSEKMLESQVDQLVLEELLREHFPRLMNHLDAVGLQVEWVTGPWFLSIFVNILPWETVLRVWDVLLYEGNRSMLFRTTLALMELYGSMIIATKDAGDIVTMLQSFAASTFDSSQLVLTACVAYQSINESQLQELREKYRPQVLAKFSGQYIEKPIWHKACEPITLSEELCKETKNGTQHQELSHEDLKDSHDYTAVKNGAGKMLLNDDVLIGVENEGKRALDLVHQVKFLKLELSKALEERQAANLRAEELETAFMELVKEDNRRLLAAKIETLEAEVAYLKRTLKEKTEQEQAMVQVMVRMEHEQKVTEDARRFAEEDAKTQRELMNALEVKYNTAVASIKELEKRTAMAESMLNATLQSQNLNNGHFKQSPTLTHSEESSRWSWSWTTSKSVDSDGITVASASSKLDGTDNASVSNNYDAPQNQGLLTRRFSLSWKDIVKGKVGSPLNSQSEVADQDSKIALTSSSSLEIPVLPSPSTEE